MADGLSWYAFYQFFYHDIIIITFIIFIIIAFMNTDIIIHWFCYYVCLFVRFLLCIEKKNWTRQLFVSIKH